MDDQEFKKLADDSLTSLYNKLGAASDDAEFEVDFNSGALAIEFENPPAKFVISPNAPVRQIWVSAHSKSYKLDWDSLENAFVLTATGQSLTELIQEAIAKQLGEEVSL
jgi:iron donor protein CyaY